ncbi:MAG: RNA polymerase subunit sigma-70 [Thermoanaerobaculia bacterium]|nr:RNA polymerase subunit sigma-70 [Thermoanaerobaculia bacterium]
MSQQDLTQLLQAAAGGDSEARSDLYGVVYEQLRQLAHAQLRRGACDDLSTTVVVHEAYLKMFHGPGLTVNDRSHFLALSSRVMRQVLVDHFRSSVAARRGGPSKPLTLDETRVMGPDGGSLVLAVHEALEHLQVLNSRLATVVEYRFFGGMSQAEIATALGVTDRTVRSDWNTARTWLAHHLGIPQAQSLSPVVDPQ